MRDIEVLRSAWRERAREQEREAAARRQQALAKAAHAAALLREKYGAERVYLYGSLVWSSHFTAHSDIDLLVEGLQPCFVKEYWKLLAEIEEITAPFHPSVILAEDAIPGLLKRVREKGVELP
ncbi:MAG TPA: nucleotidyltransferase domain-containing protein [Firmicutes bacterium]|nr:nucleotidyltransferase domain-containing protein [Bacillota bacterium]